MYLSVCVCVCIQASRSRATLSCDSSYLEGLLQPSVEINAQCFMAGIDIELRPIQMPVIEMYCNLKISLWPLLNSSLETHPCTSDIRSFQ